MTMPKDYSYSNPFETEFPEEHTICGCREPKRTRHAGLMECLQTRSGVGIRCDHCGGCKACRVVEEQGSAEELAKATPPPRQMLDVN